MLENSKKNQVPAQTGSTDIHTDTHTHDTRFVLKDRKVCVKKLKKGRIIIPHLHLGETGHEGEDGHGLAQFRDALLV